MTSTQEDIDIRALLKLDPVKLAILAGKDQCVWRQLKDFSSRLAQELDLLRPPSDGGVGNEPSPETDEKKEEDAIRTMTDREDKKAETEEAFLRYDLAVAHRLTAKFGMDMLVWNHISARFRNGCLITPGRQMWARIDPADLAFRSDNVTADIIHSAIYAARTDVHAIVHLHTPAATAVSCLESGFVPYTQDGAYFYGKVANYEWDGPSNEASEGPAISAAVSSVPGCNTLLMHNHGFACFGPSVKAAWMLAYYFERVCQVQLDLLKTGAKIKLPDKRVMEKAAETSYLPEFAPGVCEWEALCKEVSFDEEPVVD